MNYLQKALRLLMTGDVKMLLHKGSHALRKILYRLRARYEDWRIGWVSIDKVIPSKYQEQGCYPTESTDYCWLDQVFKALPLRNDDILVDIGCGEGRVLTYLYLRGFRGPMTGIELDKQVASTAKDRTAKCKNIHIHQCNALECTPIIKDATVFYLFNPFNEDILCQFIATIEESFNHPIRLYYINDLYRNQLDKRENWCILRRNMLHSPVLPKRYYTVYKYTPKDTQV